ncbi:hypothetical protein D9756_006813 [Leucocoprinus leucothites]|uniref:Uncharacterized protein n=1 Tax=Leucocoprinus leucothites TaxID=201217 RepID=A0A8H5G2F3_9AGAR|nr:hypothetical protein D9756_006813 [Leucoagaricus leucothites]
MAYLSCIPTCTKLSGSLPDIDTYPNTPFFEIEHATRSPSQYRYFSVGLLISKFEVKPYLNDRDGPTGVFEAEDAEDDNDDDASDGEASLKRDMVWDLLAGLVLEKISRKGSRLFQYQSHRRPQCAVFVIPLPNKDGKEKTFSATVALGS